AVDGATVYAAGSFTSIGGQPRPYIAALDATTGAATDWNANANSVVNFLGLSGSTVYAAGAFTSIGGQPRNKLCALDAVTAAATPWNPAPAFDPFDTVPDVITAMAVNSSKCYVAGGFKSIGGQPRNGIAALDSLTGAATPWNPDVDANDQSFGFLVLAAGGSTVYGGGTFTHIGGAPRNG